MKNKQIEIDGLKAEIKAAKCNVWEAIFTLGIACAKAAKLRNKLQMKLAGFERELAVANSINGKFKYFDGLKTLSKTLIDESTQLLDKAKEFE